MSMNVRDYRLYHYEYRRPRWSNPTYNSSHVLDSLNMFVGNEMPNHSGFSFGRYSLPKYQSPMGNYSSVLDYGATVQKNQFSTIQYPNSSNLRSISRNKQIPTDYRKTKGDDYLNMKGSRVSENVQNRATINYRLGDSLTKGLQEYQSLKK